jgi:hypothetical protein
MIMRGKVVTFLSMSSDKKMDSSTSPVEDAAKEENNIIPSNTSEPFVGSMDLDSETEKI